MDKEEPTLFGVPLIPSEEPPNPLYGDIVAAAQDWDWWMHDLTVSGSGVLPRVDVIPGSGVLPVNKYD